MVILELQYKAFLFQCIDFTMKEPKIKQKDKQNVGAHTHLKDTNALQARLPSDGPHLPGLDF